MLLSSLFTMVSLLPTNMPTAFATELLPRQAAPNLDLCKVPYLPRGRMFVLVKFQKVHAGLFLSLPRSFWTAAQP